MKISTKARHATTAMLNLALHHGTRSVTLTEISRSQEISVSYLEQLFAKLRQAKLVEGIRGPGGGYHLSRTPSRITIAQIVMAIEKMPAKRRRTKKFNELAAPLELWDDFSKHLHDHLNSLSLADLAPTLSQYRRNKEAETNQRQAA